MKIGIVGAGFTGLTAGYHLLKKGHEVSIFEQDAIPGGLAMGFKKDNWEWPIEKHYHHIFTNDTEIQRLAKEVNVPFIFKRPATSSFINDSIYQLDSPLNLLKFSVLSIPERIRMGAVLGYLKYVADWKELEQYSAHEWLEEKLGKRPYQMLWEPLIKGKFGDYYKKISLAWFWARIKARSTKLGYPEGGFQHLAEKVADHIKQNGCELFYNTSVEHIQALNPGFSIRSSLPKDFTFDAVLLTVPNIFISRLIPQFPQDYHQKLSQFEGIGAVNIILVLEKSFFDNVYWLNICDTTYPFLAVVDHTNFISPEHYGNDHIVYVGNYLPKEHRYFSLSDEELIEEYDQHLTKFNPEYKKTLKSMHVFKVPFAQPIVTQNYSQKILDFKTPLPGVYISNMQQVYPWDRGTNYAVEWGRKVAEEMDNYSS